MKILQDWGQRFPQEKPDNRRIFLNLDGWGLVAPPGWTPPEKNTAEVEKFTNELQKSLSSYVKINASVFGIGRKLVPGQIKISDQPTEIAIVPGLKVIVEGCGGNNGRRTSSTTGAQTYVYLYNDLRVRSISITIRRHRT